MRQKRKLKYADFLLPLSEDDLLPLSEGDLNNLLRPIDDVVADPDPAEPHDPTGGPVKTS